MKTKRLSKSILATIVSALPLLDINESYKPAYNIADPEAPIRKIVESIQPTFRSSLPSTAQGVFYPSSGVGFYDQDLPGAEQTNTQHSTK